MLKQRFVNRVLIPSLLLLLVILGLSMPGRRNVAGTGPRVSVFDFCLRDDAITIYQISISERDRIALRVTCGRPSSTCTVVASGKRSARERNGPVSFETDINGQF